MGRASRARSTARAVAQSCCDGREPCSASAQETVPSAQVQFNDDLLKLNREVFQLYQAGAYDQALAKANEAVALAERLYGTTDHPTAAAELKFVVQVLRAAGRSAEAEPLIRRALAIDEKALGPDNPAVALDIQILAGVLIDKTLKDAQPPAGGNRILITGQLPEILEKAVPLALFASLLLLWIYRRTVKRSMGRRSGRTRLRRQAWTSSPRLRRPQCRCKFVMTDGAPTRDAAASTLEVRGRAGPWRNAAIYTLAGIGLRADADRRLSHRRGHGADPGSLRVLCLGLRLADRADHRPRRRRSLGADRSPPQRSTPCCSQPSRR